MIILIEKDPIKMKPHSAIRNITTIKMVYFFMPGGSRTNQAISYNIENIKKTRSNINLDQFRKTN